MSLSSSLHTVNFAYICCVYTLFRRQIPIRGSWIMSGVDIFINDVLLPKISCPTEYIPVSHKNAVQVLGEQIICSHVHQAVVDPLEYTPTDDIHHRLSTCCYLPTANKQINI